MATISSNSAGRRDQGSGRRSRVESYCRAEKPAEDELTPPKVKAPEAAKPLQPEPNTPTETPLKPLLPTPFTYESTMWSSSNPLFQFRSPYNDSSLCRQEFFGSSLNGRDTPLLSPPGMTAFAPCKSGLTRPYANSSNFTIFKGTASKLHIDGQPSPSPANFGMSPSHYGSPSLQPAFPSPIMFNYQTYSVEQPAVQTDCEARQVNMGGKSAQEGGEARSVKRKPNISALDLNSIKN